MLRLLFAVCFCILAPFSTELFSAETANFPHVELLIKLPTRQRPDKFFEVLDLYQQYLSGKVSYHFLITCDEDDVTMNCAQVREKLDQYANLTYYFGHSKTKIEACNADMEHHLDFDVLLLASDDMIPRVKGYDFFIVKDMHTFFPEMDGLLHYDEGHEKTRLATLPVIGKRFYERFGYIYYPEYLSYFCDEEMTEVAKLLGKHVYIEHLLIEHVHPNHFPMPLDALYLKNSAQHIIEHDYHLYMKRKENRFGI